MQRILAGLIALYFVVHAQAKEKPVQLTDGAGRETIENYCGACHSLDYLRINSPFLDHQGWEKEVNKMIKVFGASIGPADSKIIVDYLVKNYGTGG
jgi:sulfite dehydrogenase (cytochrome) subunit B